MIPQLNQTCTLSNSTVNEYGAKTLTRVIDLDCRITQKTGKTTIVNGVDVIYDSVAHLSEEVLVKVGQWLEYNNVYYEILSVVHTRDIGGDVLFQYCELKERPYS